VTTVADSWMQRTINGEVRFSGTGLHTGVETNLRLLPADSGTGVVFVRTDFDPPARVPLCLENRRDHARRTTFAAGDAEVQTVEHLTAVLHVLGIQNLIIEIDGSEVPGLDGSAIEFLDAIESVGTCEQDLRSRTLAVKKAVGVNGDGSSLVGLPSPGHFRLSYTLHYEGEQPLTQYCSFEITPDTFRREIAPARTFVFQKEVDDLKAQGLGRGASSENTVVITPDGSVLDNELRFPDEQVRHKMLDFLGDLFVLRSRLEGNFIAHRSGHFLNAEFAQALSDSHSREREIEDVLIGSRGGLDIRDIQKLLPHRFPFLLVDRILEIEENVRAVGLKNVTFNEEFFQGHFPGQPVMPGVLQIEAMAQLAGILLMRSTADVNKLAYILSIDNAKFRKTVVPGDQLILEAELKKLRSNSGEVQARAAVDGKTVAEALIRFMIVDAY